MPSKQYFTQLIGFILYVIIELFWTFQNILYHQGNKSPFTWRVFVLPKANLVHFKQYCIVLLSSFSCTLLEQIKDICLFRLFYFYRGPVIFTKIEQSSCKTWGALPTLMGSKQARVLKLKAKHILILECPAITPISQAKWSLRNLHF